MGKTLKCVRPGSDEDAGTYSGYANRSLDNDELIVNQVRVSDLMLFEGEVFAQLTLYGCRLFSPLICLIMACITLST